MGYDFNQLFQDQVIIHHSTDTSAPNPIDRCNWIWPRIDTQAWKLLRRDWMVHKEKWFQYTRNFRLVVQAGGCCGIYPRMLADYFNVVYTFEPFPLNFYCLTLNCQTSNVLKFQAALSEKSGVCSMNIWEDNLGMSKVVIDNAGTIPTIKLDSFNFSYCDLLALDVEDHEPMALAGAKETIMRHRPTIVVENGDRDEVKNFITSCGYRYVDRSVSDSIYIPEEA